MEDFKKIGMKILVEGTKVVTLGAGVTLLTTLAKEGTDGLKKLKVEDLLK